MNTTIRTPGREVTIGAAVRKLNPHLFAKLEPEAKVLINAVPLNKPRKRIVQEAKPLLNALEAQYAALLQEKFSHRIIRAQAIRFRLANGLWYKPDLTVWAKTAELAPRAYEVKGRKAPARGVAVLKMAATQYPDWIWFLVWKEDGRWQEQRVLP